MTLNDDHLRLAINYVMLSAPCGMSRAIFAPGASVNIALGVAAVITPSQAYSAILHLGEPCPRFHSVPLLMSLPLPVEWYHGLFQVIPFAVLGLSHEAAA